MKETLSFGDAVYGLGAGIFFLGYFLFEVPSNLLLERIGARKTLLRIMVLWGFTAAAMMFVKTPMQFYIARFFLGVFEAGLFLIQGLPAAVLGVLIYFLLQDKPADADWLTSTEKNAVRYNLETDVKDIESESEGTRWDMFCDPKVYLLSLVYLVLLGATYTMVFWLPTLIQSWGVKALS
jgi:nitrate/nitrite transporter NarK